MEHHMYSNRKSRKHGDSGYLKVTGVSVLVAGVGTASFLVRVFCEYDFLRGNIGVI